MKASSTTLLLLLGSISFSEAVKIEQRHQQSAPSLNELVQTGKTDKPKKINVRKDKESLVQIEKVQKFSAKQQLNKNAKVQKLSQMEQALQAASKQVHEQAEKEESAHKASVATSALSKLKDKQMQEEKQLKSQLAADENRRMKELREGEEYARKVDQAELDRANQEILAQERATQMKELQEIEAEQRKDADKEEQEFLSAQAVQETKALAAKKAAQKAKIARMKRKHELQRHNAEAKLQLLKMEQQEEAESALKDQEAVVLQGSHESKDETEQLESILEKGRKEASIMQVGKEPSEPRKTSPEVEKILKEKEGEVDNMKDKNCSNEKKVEELLKPTKVESNLKKVLNEGLKEKQKDVVKIQKDLNDEYEKEQADLATFEKNKTKSSVQREIEARAKLQYEQNKRDRLADEQSKAEVEASVAEVSKEPKGAKAQTQAAPTGINEAGAKEIKDTTKYIGSEVKQDMTSKINDLLKSKNETPMVAGEAAVVADVKADMQIVKAPAAAAAVPSSQATKEMKDKNAAMDKIKKADKETTSKLKTSLAQELKLFSTSLNEINYDNAIKIRQQLSDLGEESSFSVNTDEIYKSSFTFPSLANNDFAQDMLDQLEETQNSLAQAPDNEMKKETFIQKAGYVGSQLAERYKNKWINPSQSQN